jgi:hypothetical protein
VHFGRLFVSADVRRSDIRKSGTPYIRKNTAIFPCHNAQVIVCLQMHSTEEVRLIFGTIRQPCFCHSLCPGDCLYKIKKMLLYSGQYGIFPPFRMFRRLSAC